MILHNFEQSVLLLSNAEMEFEKILLKKTSEPMAEIDVSKCGEIFTTESRFLIIKCGLCKEQFIRLQSFGEHLLLRHKYIHSGNTQINDLKLKGNGASGVSIVKYKFSKTITDNTLMKKQNCINNINRTDSDNGDDNSDLNRKSSKISLKLNEDICITDDALR